MDIRYYFSKVDFHSFYRKEISFDKRSIGYLIEKNNHKLTEDNLKDFEAAIIGAPFEPKTHNAGTAKAPNEIRKFLYSLSAPNPKMKLIDLGDIKKGKSVNSDFFAIRDVVEYLSESGLVVIVIGGGQEVSIGISRAFSQKKDFTISAIDPWPDMETLNHLPNPTNTVSKILKENPHIFSVNFIGYQSCFVSPQLNSQIKEMGFNSLRLGSLRNDLTLVEPLLRATDFLSFDFSSLKKSESPGYFSPEPNGLNSEEACQIARYAGLSDKLKVFGLFEANPLHDQSGLTSNLAAQMIWYFLEGFLNRKNENPGYDNQRYVEYSVPFEELNTPVVFYQNRQTERWWLVVAPTDKDKYFVPCHINDYRTASEGEIPEIWWQMIQKYDQMLK